MYPTEPPSVRRAADRTPRRTLLGLLLLGAVLGAIVGAVVSVRTSAAGYTSTAEVLMSVGASGSGSSSSDANRYLIARMSTLRELGISDAVLVPAARSLTTTPSALRPLLTFTSPTDTTVIALSTRGATPAAAARNESAVLNAFVVGVQTSEAPTGGQSRVAVTVVGYPTTPPRHATPSPTAAVTLGVAVGLVLAGCGAVLWNSRRVGTAAGRFRRWITA